MIGTVKLRYAVQDVRACMRVNTIHNYLDLHLMSLVNQILQVIGGATSGGGSEKVCHMIPERGIVAMLLNCHQLYTVIADILDSGKYLIRKLPIRRHLTLD
jgi:hypothetical protein